MTLPDLIISQLLSLTVLVSVALSWPCLTELSLFAWPAAGKMAEGSQTRVDKSDHWWQCCVKKFHEFRCCFKMCYTVSGDEQD